MILCCGESLIDMLPDDGAWRPMPGGGVFNTAVALGRLGSATSYLWPISKDAFGAALLDCLDEAGVDHTLCPRSDRPTALAFVYLENGDASYSFYDEGTSGQALQSASLPQWPENAQALFIGGISLLSDGPGEAVEELARRAAEAGAVVMIDPNIRADHVRAEHVVRERLDRLFRLADIVKISAGDGAWIVPESAGDAAERLRDTGIALVVETEGANGATAHAACGPVSHQPEPIEVVDTIGAGDSFNAGLLASLAEQDLLTRDGIAAITPDQLRGALTMACRAAGATLSRPGASAPRREEIS